jgi:hypothetical protein
VSRPWIGLGVLLDVCLEDDRNIHLLELLDRQGEHIEPEAHGGSLAIEAFGVRERDRIWIPINQAKLRIAAIPPKAIPNTLIQP